VPPRDRVIAKRKGFAATELMVSIIPPKARIPASDREPKKCSDATSWCFGDSDCAGGTNQCLAHTGCVNATGVDPFAECKTGGSTWCTGDSSGCKNGTNCGGTSSKMTNGPKAAECKSGGSTWCTGDSSGCGGGTHCVTGTNEHNLEGQFQLAYDPDEMKALRSQLGMMLQLRNPDAFRQLVSALENPGATLNIRITGVKS
jgi:hypothetical protein